MPLARKLRVMGDGRARTKRRGALAFTVALIVASSSFAMPAVAQPPADKARAEVLFNEARAAVTHGNFEEACPKFAESQRLDPAIGTLINLAECHDHEKRIASAWTAYKEAAALAAGRKDRRQKYAEDRAAALEPKLSRLAVEVAGSPDGRVVKRDGVTVEPSAYGEPIPVDRGRHTVEASEPGKKPWSTTVDLDVGSGTIRVAVPVLDPEAPAPAVATVGPEPPKTTSLSDKRTLAYVAGGVGVVALGVGTYFAFSAKSKWSDVSDVCPGGHCPDAATKDRVGSTKDDASRDATIATVGFVVGGVALAAGTALFVMSMKRDAPAPSARIAPALSPHSAGLMLDLVLQ